MRERECGRGRRTRRSPRELVGARGFEPPTTGPPVGSWPSGLPTRADNCRRNLALPPARFPRFGARKQQFSESLSESPESRTALGVLFYPPMSRIPPEDLELVAGWCASLAVAGMAPSAVVKAGKRVRAVAQSAQAGLLHATRDDLAAFVASRAARLHAGHVDPLQATLRGRSLRETVKALRAFYAWAAEHQLVNPRDVPTGGLRMRYPLPRERIRLQLGRRYDRLLHVQGPPHYVAICWLLAHGLEWREIAGLKPDDVDLERREIRLARRTMPITASALAVVCAWVGARQRLHAGQWLFGEQGRRPTRYVFQTACSAYPSWRGCAGE